MLVNCRMFIFLVFPREDFGIIHSGPKWAENQRSSATINPGGGYHSTPIVVLLGRFKLQLALWINQQKFAKKAPGPRLRQWTFRFLPVEPKNGVPKFDLAPSNGLSAVVTVVTYPGFCNLSWFFRPLQWNRERCPQTVVRFSDEYSWFNSLAG